MKILSVASECTPLVKTGGLADVVGALPEALKAQGVEMRIMLPGYPEVMAALKNATEVMAEWDLFGGPARVLAAKAKSLKVLVMDAPHLYGREGKPYTDARGQDWSDNPARFAALSWMAARFTDEAPEGWKPDIVHAHDWQAGLTPVYLAERGRPAPSILTIHNIAFQGLAPSEALSALRLPVSGFHTRGFEYYGRISFLKAGLVYADRITTVSPTYAEELLTPAFGMGLDGVLRERQDVLSGVLNGIDEETWDPGHDPLIKPYRSPRGKARARAELEAEFEFPPEESTGPLCVVVSRLTEQKGLDLLLDALPALTDRGGRLALLGAGDAGMEAAWQRVAETNPRVGVRIGYDEALAHKLIAGGDAILVPSRFEPCGLTQLYGLRYGTVPVVARTGGLADTVIDANDAALKAGVATGVQFASGDPEALVHALIRTCELYADSKQWTRIQRNAMRHAVGWQVSAKSYADLYRSLVPV